MFDWFKNFGGKKDFKGLFCNQVEAGVTGDFIKIVPVGYFPNHPKGAHQIEKRHIDEMVRNFAATKTDLLFDYEHRSLWGDSKAAGWSAEVQAREDGLYVKYPDFTKPAQEMIANREYRYFSPVYRLNAQDKLGKEIGAQVISVALTNVPYMDNEIDHIANQKIEDTDMSFSKEFLQRLGLAENATEAEINVKLNSLCQSLGLDEGATLTQISEKLILVTTPAPPEKKVDEAKANAAQIPSEVEARIKALESEKDANKKTAADALINSAVSDGKILPAHQEIWLNAAMNDFAGTKAKLDGMAKNSAMPATVDKPSDKQPGAKFNKMLSAAEYIKSVLSA